MTIQLLAVQVVPSFSSEDLPKDLGPGAIYQKTAAYGHFGRDDIEFPREHTDKAAGL